MDSKMADKLEAIVHRLEAAAAKFEALSLQSGGHPHSASVGGQDNVDGEAPMVKAFDEILGNHFKSYLDLSQRIGGDVQKQAELVEKAFKAQRDYIVLASKAKQPSMADVPELLKPTATYLEAAQSFKDANRTSKCFNHLSTVSDGMPALGWVTVSPKPAPYVEEFVNATQFYGNRVIKDHRDTDPKHVEWSRAFTNTLKEMHAYVKKHHTTGLVWSKNGGDAKTIAKTIGGAAPAAAAGGAPPPPPPPPAGGAPPPPPPGPGAPPVAQKPDMSGLFNELNKGSAITSGLKKVDRSQMTHKNPSLRESSVVKADAIKKKSASPVKVVETKKPPKCQLEGKKWIVEYQEGGQQVIENCQKQETVYVYKCNKNTIQIKGKVNQITIDNCKKTAIVFENAVSGCEMVNSQSIQVQVLGTVPTVSIDKTDGVQIYLSKDSLDTEIVSAKSSEMNVIIPGATEDDDWVEAPIAEQFKTTFVNGKFVTTCVEHSGG
eukprot:Nk52_evm24s311 gene=Nk52_evmTU24s311